MKKLIAPLFVLVLMLPGLQGNAQEAPRPEAVNTLFASLLGSWEGSMHMQRPGGMEMDIPMTYDFEPLLDTTSVICTLKMVMGNYVVNAIEVYSWSALTNQVIMFGTSGRGEVTHSAGPVPVTANGPIELVLTPIIYESKELTGTTVMHMQNEGALQYKIVMKLGGEDLVTQTIQLHRN
ncbi:hypothetical protein KQI65_15660 [bacterium]|nr:hypothetical protein [bacterium]